MRAVWAALVASLVMLALALAAPSAAQEEPSGISYITPFPEGDVYKLQAYGDGFAEGLLNGLVEAFASDGRLQVLSRPWIAFPLAPSSTASGGASAVLPGTSSGALILSAPWITDDKTNAPTVGRQRG